MTVIRSWSGDGAALGPVTTSSAGTGDTPFDGFWGTPSPTIPTIVNSGPRAPQIEFATVSSKSPGLYWNYSTQTVGSGRIYLDTPSAWNSVSHSLVEIHLAGGGTQIAARITLAGTGSPGQLRLYSADATTLVGSTPSNTLSVSTRYRIEWIVNHVAGTMTVKLYLGDSLTELASIGGSSNYGINQGQVLFGNYSAAATPTLNMDDFAIGDSAVLIGPKAAPSAPTITVWNGTAEVPATISVWNGTAEVAAHL